MKTPTTPSSTRDCCPLGLLRGNLPWARQPLTNSWGLCQEFPQDANLNLRACGNIGRKHRPPLATDKLPQRHPTKHGRPRQHHHNYYQRELSYDTKSPTSYAKHLRHPLRLNGADHRCKEPNRQLPRDLHDQGPHSGRGCTTKSKIKTTH